MRNYVMLAIAIAASSMAGAALAADAAYPTKAVRIVVVHAPGGPTDIMARIVGQKLSERWGQPVVVDNRPGAGGNIGTQLVARASADGYTLLVNTTAYAVNPSLYSNAGYDPFKDFAPIVIAGTAAHIIFTTPSVPATTLPALIALAKQKPLSYASAGAGTTAQMTGEMLFRPLGGVDITHVPYNGAGPAITSVLGAQNPIGITAVPPTVALIKQNRLRGIAVTSTERSPVLPDVGTVAEQGFPGFAVYVWIGFFAPAGTPAAVVAQINRDITQTVAVPETKERLGAIGFDPLPNTPQQFREYLGREVARYAKVVKETGAKVE